ncbi:MAG: hypothetical protein U0989_04605 [Azonexus sp.]|nr:hypothetical protein [Azonexus sp.]
MPRLFSQGLAHQRATCLYGSTVTAGWEIARKLSMTMIGRAQGKHYLLFTGEERFSR